MKNYFYRILCGFVLGISIFAPGVSGSVMAIIMGIYNRLIGIVANPFKDFKKNVIYLFPMGIGAVISLILFVLVFSYLFEMYETATCLLFIGLMAGNLPVVSKQAAGGRFKKHYLVGLIVAFILAMGVGIIGNSAADTRYALSENIVYLGVSGAAAGVVSLIPGISISTILMVFGVYSRLMRAARSIEILVIFVVGVCFVAAMILSSRLIKYVFNRYFYFSNYLVLGFMCGSIVSIFLGLNTEGFNWLIGLLMLAAGLGVSLLFVYLGRRFDTAEQNKY